MKIDMSKVDLSEKDIENWLYENPEVIGFVPGRGVKRWFGRQYALPSGIADLIGVMASGALLVIEVKNVAINKAAILQVCRYAADIEQIHLYSGSAEPSILKMVVGPSVDGQTFIEALACDVSIFSFTPQVELVFGQMTTTQEYAEATTERYIKIGGQPEWNEYHQFLDERREAERKAKPPRRYSLDEAEKDDAASRPRYSLEVANGDFTKETKDKYDELLDSINVDEEENDG